MIVALFGSASNLVGHRPSRPDDEDGYYPSDIVGIYSLLDAVREHSDPEIDVDYRLDDAAMSAPARAESAVHLAQGGVRYDLGELDVLARVYLDVEGVTLSDGPARVIIGTPLWIATPRPQPIRY